jgi:hypothetical protein
VLRTGPGPLDAQTQEHRYGESGRDRLTFRLEPRTSARTVVCDDHVIAPRHWPIRTGRWGPRSAWAPGPQAAAAVTVDEPVADRVVEELPVDELPVEEPGTSPDRDDVPVDGDPPPVDDVADDVPLPVEVELEVPVVDPEPAEPDGDEAEDELPPDPVVPDEPVVEGAVPRLLRPDDPVEPLDDLVGVVDDPEEVVEPDELVVPVAWPELPVPEPPLLPLDVRLLPPDVVVALGAADDVPACVVVAGTGAPLPGSRPVARPVAADDLETGGAVTVDPPAASDGEPAVTGTVAGVSDEDRRAGVGLSATQWALPALGVGGSWTDTEVNAPPRVMPMVTLASAPPAKTARRTQGRSAAVDPLRQSVAARSEQTCPASAAEARSGARTGDRPTERARRAPMSTPGPSTDRRSSSSARSRCSSPPSSRRDDAIANNASGRSGRRLDPLAGGARLR